MEEGGVEEEAEGVEEDVVGLQEDKSSYADMTVEDFWILLIVRETDDTAL